MFFPSRTVRDNAGKVKYVPFVSDAGDDYPGRVGYRVERDDGKTTYIYFNPSDNSAGSPTPDVFVYIGSGNTPDKDESEHFYAFGDEEFAIGDEDGDNEEPRSYAPYGNQTIKEDTMPNRWIRVNVDYGDDRIRTYKVWAADDGDAEEIVSDLSLFYVSATDYEPEVEYDEVLNAPDDEED